jgi:hypothetical protein
VDVELIEAVVRTAVEPASPIDDTAPGSADLKPLQAHTDVRMSGGLMRQRTIWACHPSTDKRLILFAPGDFATSFSRTGLYPFALY